MDSTNSTDEILQAFMLENFDYSGLKKAGVYGKGIKKSDYKAQAERICYHFCLNSIFEYGQDEIRCHISTGENMPDSEFITTIKSRALIPKQPPYPNEAK